MQFRVFAAACGAIIVGTALHAAFVTSPALNYSGPTAESAADRERAPPFLRITKDRFSAYLLPESHIGSPLEFGPRFHSVVIPAARRSSTLVYEGLNGDTFPGSPHWGRTCLDSLPEAGAIGAQLTSRIVANHRHSQWADLRRAFSEISDAFAVEQFTAFIQARGLMINFWELHSRIHALVEREVAVRQSVQPEVTQLEYSAEFGAHAQIAKMVPHLEVESIETLEDHAWALCQLTRAQQREALQDAIDQFDGLESRAAKLTPGARLQEVEMAFATLHAQLRLASVSGQGSAASSSNPATGHRPDAREPTQHSSSSRNTLDKLRFGLRNERWAQRIDEHALAGRPGLIYVLGSDHLLDFSHSASLLTLLKQRGFRVEVVQ